MHELHHFGLVVLVVAGAFAAAVLVTKLTEFFPVPSPAVFLIAAAGASDIWPSLILGIRDVERIAVVALVIILFDGGMQVGRRRFRAAAAPITILGVLGTFGTAGLVAIAAHTLFDFGWTTAGILGAALAPTDPAVMFSVLGKREVGGRTGTILEGESGANDPVGIALMIGMIEFATRDNASFWIVVREFAVEMAVGLAIGVVGAFMLLQTLRRISLPREALFPLGALAVAGVVYGVATVAHGSGFLAAFVAGLVVGDARVPFRGEIQRFHTSLASLAEIVVFVALGLTIDLGGLPGYDVWLDGILLALLLSIVARPVVVWVLLLPVKLRVGERLFVMWGGLKGAVPILLAAFALLAGVEQDRRIYGIVFVVVLFSVVVQGTSIPFVAPALGVPMRRRELRGAVRYRVVEGAHAAGRRIDELPLGEYSWIEAVMRAGAAQPARGKTIVAAGDELLVFTESQDTDGLRRLFEEAR